MIYRVPYKLTTRGAANKARIVYGDETGAQWIEFTAGTRKEACTVMQELILHGDPRPVMGRSGIRNYAVREEP